MLYKIIKSDRANAFFMRTLVAVAMCVESRCARKIKNAFF